MSLSADEWKYNGIVQLAKDEFYHLGLQEGDVVKDLYFRWTLHQNEGLVMHLHYDGFVHQFVLYERHRQRGYRLQLFSHNPRSYVSSPYIWILFQDYAYDKKIATIKFLIHDGNRSVSLIAQEKVKNVGFRGY